MSLQLRNEFRCIPPDQIVRHASFPADPHGHGFHALAIQQPLPDPRSDVIRGEDNTAAGVKKDRPVFA
jgi:hypothetical protein